MIEKRVLNPQRLRRLTGSFAFIEHRFLRDGFFASLTHFELLLYIFLVMAADRAGLSYYSFEKICTLLAMDVDEYIVARNELIAKDLIAFDGRLFQVLSLPQNPVISAPRLLRTAEDMEAKDPATIHQIIKEALK